MTIATDASRRPGHGSTDGAYTAPFQPLPSALPLHDQLDLSIQQLSDRIPTRFAGRGVYPYVVASVKQGPDGRFRQEGCSPNIQGGVITLCNCKHQMRTYAAFQESGGVWVAGITGGGLTARHRRFLFYLMLARPVRSQAEMWRRLPPASRQAKDATRDRFGELYPPRRENLAGPEMFDPSNYLPPMAGHVHSHNWQKDLTYDLHGRRPALLLGDVGLSFIWSRPRLWLRERQGPLSRNPAHSDTLQGFLDRLSEEGSDL